MSLPDIVFNVLLPAVAASMLLTCGRLWLGPSLPDRLLALDVLTTIGIGLLGLLAVASGNSAFVDVSLVVALMAFLGTVAFLWHLKQEAARDVDV